MEDYKEIAARELPKYQHLLKWHDTQLRDKLYRSSSGRISFENGYLLGVIYEAYVNAWKDFDPKRMKGGLEDFGGYLGSRSKYFMVDVRRKILEKEREQASANRNTAKVSVSQLDIHESGDVAEEITPFFDEDTWNYYVDGLSDRTKRILKLKFIDGLSQVEISRMERLSKERIGKIIDRGLSDIKARLTVLSHGTTRNDINSVLKYQESLNHAS